MSAMPDEFHKRLEIDAGWDGRPAVDKLDALLDSIDIDRGPNDSSRLLHSVAWRSLGAARYLTSRGANLEVRDSDGSTALHTAACVLGRGEIHVTEAFLRLLLSAGFRVDAVDRWGRTPLFLAARGDCASPRAVLRLLEHGADPDPIDQRGHTPLMYAVAHPCSASAQLLLEHGADPTRVDRDGRSVLTHGTQGFNPWIPLELPGFELAGMGSGAAGERRSGQVLSKAPSLKGEGPRSSKWACVLESEAYWRENPGDYELDRRRIAERIPQAIERWSQR